MAQNPGFESHIWHQWVDCLSCGIAFPRRFDGLDEDIGMVVITCMNCTGKRVSVSRWCTAEEFEEFDWTWANRLTAIEKDYMQDIMELTVSKLDGIELRQINNRMIPGLRNE
jgi:hypothetical protein